MGNKYLIRLPWPPKELSSNTRTDRRYTGHIRRKYKSDCAMMLRSQQVKIPPNALLDIGFHPPDKRRRDLDNMLTSIKYGIDGLAIASDCDDYGWAFTIWRGKPVKDGCVLVMFEA